MGFDLDKAVGEIRDLINGSDLWEILSEDLVEWNALCSALDAVGDTEGVITLALSREIEDPDWKECLLEIYAVLQALVVQQDAVERIAKNARVPLSTSEKTQLKRIRDIRVSSVGHPVMKDRGNPEHSSFLSRPRLTRHEFDLHRVVGDKTEIEHVCIPDLVESQHEILSRVLRDCINGDWQKEGVRCS